MVKITHYEVYTDAGDGWKLEDRFSSEQRYEAINLSKEKEQENLKVKIIRENFDVQDNSYQETVEYVSGLSLSKAKVKRNIRPLLASDIRRRDEEPTNTINSGANKSSGIGGAIVKLVSIIVFSLVVANIFVTLVTPLVEDFIPENRTHIYLFVIFFMVFLGIAVPIILKKIPWYVFSYRRPTSHPIKESRFYEKAENIIKLYQLNDEYETSIAPSFPEASLDQKRYIVEFLKDILSNLNSKSMFQDSFSTLGVKLIVYGGCLELSRYCKLRISEANSLLFEAFKILDGHEVDLEAFYDGKKSFSDNKIAVFLTGVGAHLMGQIIDEHPMDVNILKQSFDKWEAQIANNAFIAEKISNKNIDIMCHCFVNVQCLLKFFDEAIPNLNQKKKDYWNDVHNLIHSLLNKYSGNSIQEQEGISTIEYSNTEEALRFASEFIKDINVYKEELSDENLIFLSKCNIIDKLEDEEIDQNDYIKDALEHTYNNEILVTEKIKNSMYSDRYGFEFLGDKRLNKTDKLVALYKLIY